MPIAENNNGEHFEDVYKHIGEFGQYQFTLVVLISMVSFIPSIVAYGFTFYGATPDHRWL